MFKEVACLTDVGKAFFSLGSETVNEPVFKDVLVFGTINEPFSDDLRFLLIAIAVDVSKSDICAGVRSFKALYVKTACLELIRWDIT